MVFFYLCLCLHKFIMMIFCSLTVTREHFLSAKFLQLTFYLLLNFLWCYVVWFHPSYFIAVFIFLFQILWSRFLSHYRPLIIHSEYNYKQHSIQFAFLSWNLVYLSFGWTYLLILLSNLSFINFLNLLHLYFDFFLIIKVI